MHFSGAPRGKPCCGVCSHEGGLCVPPTGAQRLPPCSAPPAPCPGWLRAPRQRDPRGRRTPGHSGDAAPAACGNAASPKPHQGSCALDNCLFCLAPHWEGRSAVRFLFYFYPQIKFSVRFGLYFFPLVCPTTKRICFVF